MTVVGILYFYFSLSPIVFLFRPPERRLSSSCSARSQVQELALSEQPKHWLLFGATLAEGRPPRKHRWGPFGLPSGPEHWGLLWGWLATDWRAPKPSPSWRRGPSRRPKLIRQVDMQRQVAPFTRRDWSNFATRSWAQLPWSNGKKGPHKASQRSSK